MQVKQGGQKIYFLKRDDLTKESLEEVDWESWSLKRSMGELHTLTVKLTYPDKWIDKTSPTGLRMNIGDEMHLYATFGVNNDDQEPWGTHRFGGYITNVKTSFDGAVVADIECKDYKLALKNRQVFKSYYKTMPQTIGQNSYYIKKMYSAATLYDAIINLGAMCNITDTSQLETPYVWTKSNTSCITKTVGAAAYCTLYNGFPSRGTEGTFGSKQSHKLVIDSSDSEVVYELYNNVTGYDAVETPNIVMKYHKPKATKTTLGFRVTVNGTAYYIPWFDTLDEYDTGSNLFLKTVQPIVTKKPTVVTIPIKDFMDEAYPSYTYNVTKIEVLSKDVKTGNFYLMDIGGIDPYQTIKVKHEYKYDNALSIANSLAAQCGHYFDISPDKELLLYNLQHQISNRSVVEGENLLTSDVDADDSDLANNIIVASNLGTKKACLGQDIDLQSMVVHGEYDFVEEKSDLKTKQLIRDEAKNVLASKSTIIPTYSCSVLPDFGFKEGEVIYVYNPSLGIERSMQIQNVTWNHSGQCDMELGTPSTTLEKYLIQLNNKQKIGRDMAVEALEKAMSDEKLTHAGVYLNPKGKITVTGTDLVADGVNLQKDQVEYDGVLYYLWREPNTDVYSTEAGVKGIITSLVGTPGGVGTVFGIPFTNFNGVEIDSIRVDISWGGVTTGSGGFLIGGSIYSEFDPSDETVNLLETNSELYYFSSSSGSTSVTIPYYATPDLDYYHIKIDLDLWMDPIVNMWMRIDRVQVVYNATGAYEDV